MTISNLSRQTRLLPGLAFGQKTTRIALFIALGLILIMLGLFFIFYQKLPPQVPLFYSRPWGEAQLASPWFLLALPLLSLFVVALNFILGGLFFNSLFLVHVLAWGATAFAFLALFTLMQIILVII
ncbi:MAG: hypothetical protein PHR64_00545 [Candidatus Shapirobacteria bacterium]|nr:hypothetical protein [Candidatus Shapirobacteria bacterium]MDD5074092.1 hypothetical protein [Candidatus Shapirobacteria bacterium]MDD5481426.1 hypothetical protein [Candidatus Shapirobacteria bacterium]